MDPLKKEALLQAGKFTLFSASAGLIQIGSYALFHDVFMWEHWFSYLISLILSVLWNFTFNRRFTFHSAANVPKAMAQVAAFYAVFTPLSTWLGNVLVHAGAADYLVEVGTMLVNFILEFIYQKFVVFREPKEE